MSEPNVPPDEVSSDALKTALDLGRTARMAALQGQIDVLIDVALIYVAGRGLTILNRNLALFHPELVEGNGARGSIVAGFIIPISGRVPDEFQLG